MDFFIDECMNSMISQEAEIGKFAVNLEADFKTLSVESTHSGVIK